MSTRPTVGVFIAFTNTPFQASSALTWVDVSSYVRTSKDGGSAISTRRGRQSELGRVEAGTLSLVLDNRTRVFDPLNTASAYYPNVIPMKRIQVRATWNAVTYPLFTGYIESWEPAYPGGQDGMVRVRASDLFKAIGRTVITVSAIPDADGYGEGTGAAIYTALNQIGWPAATDYSGTTSGQTRIAGTTYASINGLQYIQTIAETENGLFFISPAGIPTFQDRLYRLTNTTAIATFGTGGEAAASFGFGSGATALVLASTAPFAPSGTIQVDAEQMTYTTTTSTQLQGMTRGVNGTVAAAHSAGALVIQIGEQPYESVTPSYDDTQIYNDVRVTRNGGTERPAVTDATSQAAYGPRNLSKSGLYYASDIETDNYAQWILYIYKDPVYRFKSMVLNGDVAPTTLWPILLNTDISVSITVHNRPPGGGALIRQSARVENIAHTIDGDTWRTEWALSINNDGTWFTLDSATIGLLDTNKLAF